MKRRAAWLAGLCVVVVASLASAAPPRDIDELRARISGVLLREHVPGAGIALIDGDDVIWAGGVGVADRSTGRPVTADTLFRAGSITKTFLSLALVALSEQGRIDLRAPVAALAPELAIANRWDAESPITVAHLLEHTAGFDDMHPNETNAPLAAEAMPLADVLARNPASRVARWRPGSRFSYANPGYTVAAYLIEKVTRRPYEEVLTRQLFVPLGMAGAALRWSPAVNLRLARGYDHHGAPVPYQAIYHRPAGNLMVSPRDLAALVRLQLARGRLGGRTIVSPTGMARTERSETAWLDAGDASYGLGNGGDVSERAVIRGHNGGIDGFLSAYGYLPGQGVGFVVLLNSTRSFEALLAIRHLVVEYLLTGQPVPPAPPRVEVSEAELQQWAGAYHDAAPRHQLFAALARIQPGLELFVERGRLFVRRLPASHPPLELVPLGGDRFRIDRASAAHVRLGRDREGRRILIADGAYFVEEPRLRTLAYAVIPLIIFWLLATAFAMPLGALRRRAGPTPGFGWPVCATVALFGAFKLFVGGHDPYVLGECNFHTLGVCALTIAFAIASIASMVQAITWLALPGSLVGKLHRLCFGLAACTATAFLAAYGLIGIRLWLY